MGQFVYGSVPERITMDDRALAHVKLVILAKLRRNEAFAFNVEYDGESGGGRTTLWLAPSIQLQFKFDGSRPPAVNKAWLDALMHSANSPEGLRVLAEPPETAVVPPITASIPVHRDGLR
jgi:hypothetical protein